MRWLLGATALLLLAIALDLGLLAYAMYALVGVIVGSRMLANAWSAHLTATRQINVEKIKIGGTVAVVIVLEHRGALPVPWLLLEDLLPRRALMFSPPNLQVTGRRLQLASFRGRSRKTLSYQLKCNRRGYYQIGPLVAETGDVFGLYRRYRVLTAPSFLMALPDVVPLEGFDVASRRPIGEVRMSYRLFEDPTRIAGVREYQSGDALSRINWRATARTGLLQSKVYEPSTVAGATILLDFHQQSFVPKDEPVRSELAVTAVASIAGAICEMGQQAGLVTNARDAAERIRREGWSHEQLTSRRLAQAAGMRETSTRLRPLVVPTRRSNTQLRLILETLARVEKTDGFTFAQMIRESASRIPRDASVIAVLTAVTAETAVALGSLRNRGFAVTAIINVYDEYEFAKLAAPLVAERIDARQLRDRAAIPTVCLKTMVR
jgi:uncharacterized protein (DUF58 family)